MLAAWRHRRPRAFRIGSWYLLAALSLTVLWLATVALAPETGLTRSYWHPDIASADPVVEQRITALDLAFIDEQDRPTRNYRVRWEGVWFSPRAESVSFYAGADDGVILRVDGETVLERNPALGMHTEMRTVKLGAGAHQVEVEHWQAGGGRMLNVQWARSGGAATLLSPNRLFLEDPGALGYWLRFAATRLPGVVLLVWATGVSALIGLRVRRSLAIPSRDEIWTRLRAVLLPAALGPSQLLLVGPWTVHNTNRSEFLVGFWELAPGWFWLLAPIVGGLSALGILLPARWFPRYTAALFAAGVLLWTQGNLLLADYGVLDGGGLDLASHAWRAPLEASLWIGVLALAVVFAGVAARAAPVASGVLVALQVVVLLVPMSRETSFLGTTSGSTDGAETGWRYAFTNIATLTDAVEPAWRLPPPEIYQLSSTRNIIHIVLDAFPTHVFAGILDADRSVFDHEWSGFTFFADHLGAHGNTMLSVPTMLSGVPWRNEMPFPEFLARHPSVFNVLGQQGYRLRSLNAYVRDIPGVEAALQYDIPFPYGNYRNYVDVTAARLLDLALFRHAPHALKAGVYNNGRWLLQRQIELWRGPEATADRPFGDTEFLREFADRMIPVENAPVYTFLQIYTPHLPVITDADCAYVPTTADPETFANQARCALSAVQALLQRLRDLNLYDRSAIIVTSDHGVRLDLIAPEEEHPLRGIRTPAGVTLPQIEAYAAPLLLVKPFAAQGPLETSFAPTSIIDVPATLLDLAHSPDTLGRGVSLLRMDPAASRRRTYGHARRAYPSPFFDILHEFAVNGRVTDRDAWSHYRSVFGPADDRAAQRREYSIGLVAAPGDTGSQPGRHVYRTDDYAVFYASPENSDVTFDVRRMPTMALAQTVTVRIDGVAVDERVLAHDAWHTLSYPVETRSENTPFCIELSVTPAWSDEEGESWGLMLRGDI